MDCVCVRAYQLMLRKESPVLDPALVGAAVEGTKVGHLGQRDAEEEEAGQAQEPRVAPRASVRGGILWIWFGLIWSVNRWIGQPTDQSIDKKALPQMVPPHGRRLLPRGTHGDVGPPLLARVHQAEQCPQHLLLAPVLLVPWAQPRQSSSSIGLGCCRLGREPVGQLPPRGWPRLDRRGRRRTTTIALGWSSSEPGFGVPRFLVVPTSASCAASFVVGYGQGRQPR
jgi:hypothetical protein